MSDERALGAGLVLPSVEEVERGLGLDARDREDELPGLYRMNVVRVPLTRLAAFALALAVVPLHNLLVLGGLDGRAWLVLAAAVLAYCLGSWLLLRLLFVRLRPFHLGTLFVWTDLVVMTALVGATGAERSLLWPIYFVRVADQIWIGRRRAAALAAGGLAAYATLLLWRVLGEGASVNAGVELVKLLVLAAMSAALAAGAAQPWSVRDRTRDARDLILRLEDQSRELDRERVRAQTANRAKSDFLARMSHELRTPLNSVVGFTNVLLRRAGEGRDRDYLERIRQNGLHLLALIDDILDLARIEEGRMIVHAADVDLAVLVHETVRQLEGRALGGRVVLKHRVPETPVILRADEARLRQVLVNLVGNALKFTERGSVDVSVEADPLTGTPRFLRVRDTGIGIAGDRIPAIFEAFEQADGGASRSHGGAGLGLAISRSLCQRMGFDLTVESAPGKGSEFTISFAPLPGAGDGGGPGAPVRPPGARPA